MDGAVGARAPADPAPAAGHRPVIALPPGARAWDDGLALEAADGTALRAAIWRPGPAATADRGLALLLTGRVEFLEKIALPATALSDRGYTVASLDWRGQGLSARALRDRRRAHVDDFERYDADLAALLSYPALAALGPVRVVLSHSMGGCILQGALARGTVTADRLIYSAPMAGVRAGGAAKGALPGVARTMRALGLGGAWPPAPRAGRAYVLKGFDGNCLTSDRTLYDWYADGLREKPSLALGLPTFGWLAAAFDAMEQAAALQQTHIPSLVLIGSREGVVDPAAVRAMARAIDAKLAVIDGARHDLFMETPPRRAALWQAIDEFLGLPGTDVAAASAG
ncbi:MAG: alpha/beta hydrolase [Pseudomonadota bacterium]